MAIDSGTWINVGFYIYVSIAFAILAVGFNLQWGYTGLFNAGIAGFFLIGAYTAAFASSARTSMSAHMCLTAWNVPIGRPNCSRSFA